MTAFPQLLPSELNYDLGGLNVTSASTLAGTPILFRHSLKQSNYKLTLTYTNLLNSEVSLIRNHYVDSAGIHKTFTLPAAIWGGTSVMPAAALMRYAAEPSEQQRGVYTDITVELLAVDANLHLFKLIGEGSSLGAEESVSSFPMSGTGPFILEADDADPAEAAILLLQGGGAQP